jgi:hypothetical protein
MENSWMEPLIRSAERIKNDQALPRELVRKFLYINRGLQRELRKYFQALEILKGSKKFLEKVASGKMTVKECEAKIRRARQQVKETESFAQVLSKISGVTI